MPFQNINNNPNWEYDTTPPDPGATKPQQRKLWLKSTNGIRTTGGTSVYVRCRKVGKGNVDMGEISKTYWDAR